MKSIRTLPAGTWPAGSPHQARLVMLGCLAGMVALAGAADVNFMAVVKGQRFVQGGPDFVMLVNAAQPADDRPLVLEAFADESAPGALTGGTVSIPDGRLLPLGRTTAGEPELRNEYQTEALLDLDTARPDGTYTFTLATLNDGPRSVSLSLGGGTYPPVPRISNYNALQNLTATANTTVQWTPFTGGTSYDFVMLSVSGEGGAQVFSTPGPGEAGSLNGTAVQATIPAGALQAGRTYHAELLFVKVVDMDSAYAMAIAGYYKLVRFDMAAAAQPGVATGAALQRVLPGDFQSGVGRDSAVTFRFSRPMNPSYQAVGWSGGGLVGRRAESGWILLSVAGWQPGTVLQIQLPAAGRRPDRLVPRPCRVSRCRRVCLGRQPFGFVRHLGGCAAKPAGRGRIPCGESPGIPANRCIARGDRHVRMRGGSRTRGIQPRVRTRFSHGGRDRGRRQA